MKRFFLILLLLLLLLSLCACGSGTLRPANPLPAETDAGLDSLPPEQTSAPEPDSADPDRPENPSAPDPQPETAPEETEPGTTLEEPEPETDPAETEPETDPAETEPETDPKETGPETDPKETEPETDPAETEPGGEEPDPLEKAAAHVISHRGASGEAFEHTFAAYDLAIAEGTRYIEQDLVSSAEGTLYVSHNKSPECLADEKRRFSELTDAEIDSLMLPDGSHFLKMSEVLDRYGDGIHYVIELRSPEQLTPLLELIRERGLENNVILQSWTFAILHEIQKQMPEAGRLFLAPSQELLEKALVQPYVEIIAANASLMCPENCDLVHEAGKQFGVYALNTPTELRWAILMGVDLYFTDFTANALRMETIYRTED